MAVVKVDLELLRKAQEIRRAGFGRVEDECRIGPGGVEKVSVVDGFRTGRASQRIPGS